MRSAGQPRQLGLRIVHAEPRRAPVRDYHRLRKASPKSLCQEISQADYLVLESNHDEEMLRAGRYPEMLKRRILSPRGHLSNAACAQALSDYLSERCQHVWLCHLSRDNNRPEIAYSCAASALERFPDVQLTVLNRTEPMLFELDTE